MVKNLSANAGDLDSVPGSGRSPGEGNGNPLSRSAWEIPWTDDSGRLQSSPQCHKRVRHDLATKQQQILYLDGAFEMFPIIYRYFSGTVTMGTKTLNSGWLTLTCIQTGSTVSSSGRLNVTIQWKIGVGMERCRFPCQPGGCNSCFRGHAPHLLSASLWSPLAGEIWLGGSPLFLPDVKFYYVSLAISLIFV